MIPEHLRRTGKYVGQKQKWFLLRFHGHDDEICLENGDPPQEFDDWRWEEPAFTLSQIAEFKRNAYEKVMHEFADIITGKSIG